MDKDYRTLIEAARAARRFAYQPYSEFSVGAAVLTFDGGIYSGCNVENASYTQTIHAEQVAMTKAISEGALERALKAGLTQFQFIKAIAVCTPKGCDPWPCCNCRQSLCEFGLDMVIVGESADGSVVTKELRELIPFPLPVEEVLASAKGRKNSEQAVIAQQPTTAKV